MSSKPVRKSKRKRKQSVYSTSKKNKSSEKKIIATDTDDDVNVRELYSGIQVTSNSPVLDFDEHANGVHPNISHAAISGKTSSHHVSKEEMPIKNKPEKTRISELSNILSATLKEQLKSSSRSVSRKICEILSEHTLQNLKKVIKHGIDYMKLCGRSNFTAEDFDRGLFVCGEWNADESEHCFKNFDITCDGFVDCKNPSFEGEWLENNNLVSKGGPNVPVPLQDYFLEVTKVLLKEDEELCAIIWKDLETNSSLLRLVPYFVKFLSECIDSLSSDLARVSNLLRAMRSLLLNPHLQFFHDSDSTTVAFTLLKFLLLDLPQWNKNTDFRFLKDYSAYLLKQVIKKSRSVALTCAVMNKIESFLSDSNSHSFVSQYGAIGAVNSIGVIAILWLMPSVLTRYFERISQTDSNNEKHNFGMVKEQLVCTHYILTQHFFRYDFDQTLKHPHLPEFLRDKVISCLSNCSLTEYFGDILVPHFPLSDSVSFNVSLKKKVNTIQNKKHSHRLYSKYVKKENTCKKTSISRDLVFDVVPLKSCNIKFRRICGKYTVP